MKGAKPTGWRAVMNRSPRPSDFGLSPLADNVDSITQRQRVRISRIRHGIGGGMQLYDESDLIHAAPSRFSGEWMGRRLSLTGGRVLLGVYTMSLLAFLLIAHVHLRFQIHDIQMQQHGLQTIHRQLERQITSIDRHVAHRSNDLRHLKDHAVLNLRMVENQDTTELSVSKSLVSKYDMTIGQGEPETATASSSTVGLRPSAVL